MIFITGAAVKGYGKQTARGAYYSKNWYGIFHYCLTVYFDLD